MRRSFCWFSRGGCLGQYFDDITSDMPFVHTVNRMKTASITNGCQPYPPKYCPVETLTRQAAAAFIIRALYGETFTYTSTPYFEDVPGPNDSQGPS